MKYEMTTCPKCNKALAWCAEKNLLPETRRSINKSKGWAWDQEQCQECWLRERGTKHD